MEITLKLDDMEQFTLCLALRFFIEKSQEKSTGNYAERMLAKRIFKSITGGGQG